MYKYGVIINLTERTKLDNFQTYENQIKKKKKEMKLNQSKNRKTKCTIKT